ncbi:MAG: LysM domain-containing protein, partial [Terriglobales bacterium]
MSLPEFHRLSSPSTLAKSGVLRSALMLARVVILSTTVAAVQNPHAAHLIQVNAATVKNASVQTASSRQAAAPAPVAVPPGNELYTAQRGDSIPSVARKYLRKTKYLTSSELAEAIRSANGNRPGTFLKPGEQLLIPGILEAPIIEKSVPVA